MLVIGSLLTCTRTDIRVVIDVDEKISWFWPRDIHTYKGLDRGSIGGKPLIPLSNGLNPLERLAGWRV